MTINSYSCSDLRGLPGFSKLESLAVGGRITRVPGRYIPQSLREFAGPYAGFEALIAGSPLSRIKVALNSKRLGAVTPTVKELVLTSARELSSLDAIADLPNLRELVVHGAKDLDVASIARLSGLTSLKFENCGRLQSVESISDLGGLSSLTLEDVRAIDDLGNVGSLEIPVRVIGKHPFDRQFCVTVGSNWVFPAGTLQKG